MSVLAALGLAVVFAAFSSLSLWALEQSTRRSLEERLLLAKVAAQSIDHYNRDVLNRLQKVGAGIIHPGDMEADRAALHSAWVQLGSVGQELFLLNRQGKLILAEPANPQINNIDMSRYLNIPRIIGDGSVAISNVIPSDQGSLPRVIYAAPARDVSGSTAGVIGTYVDLNMPSIDGFIQAIKLGRTGYAQVVDGKGMLVASTLPEAVFGKDDHGDRFTMLIDDKKAVVRTCHSCHLASNGSLRRRDVLAFAPLETASWGVAVRQSEAEALAPTNTLRRGMLAVGGLSLALALASTILLGSRIVRPIRSLTVSARRIARGDLDSPISTRGKDEVGVLAQDFESMRQKLKQSHQQVEAHTRTIERRNQEREELVKRIISVQEEERKRLARELHDETAQMLSALIMRVEATGSQLSPGQDDVRQELDDIRVLANQGLSDIRKLTLSLRPAALDDLGLVSAIRWYAEKYLENRGIKVFIEARGLGSRLPPQLETALFRVVQEAINNIARHSAASTARISLMAGDSNVTVEVQDNGRGFDTAQLGRPKQLSTGLGLLGMQERMTLLGGSLQINSQPGQGTRILAEVPMNRMEV